MSARHEVALAALFADVGDIAARANVQPPPSEAAALRRELAQDGVEPTTAAMLTYAALKLRFPERSLAAAAVGGRSAGALGVAVAKARQHLEQRIVRGATDDEAEARRRRLEPAWAWVWRTREGVLERRHLPLAPLSFRIADLDSAEGDGPSPAVAASEYAQGVWSGLESGLDALVALTRAPGLEGEAGDERRGAAEIEGALGLLLRLTARVPAAPTASLVDVSHAQLSALRAAVATALFVEAEGGGEGLALFACELRGGEALIDALGEDASPNDITGRVAWPALLVDALQGGLLGALAMPASSIVFRAAHRFVALVPARLAARASAFAADASSRLVDFDVPGLSLAHGTAALSLGDLHGGRLSLRLAALEATMRESADAPHADLLGRAHGHAAIFAPVAPELAARRSADAAARFGELGAACARTRAIARVSEGAASRVERALRDAGAKPALTVSFAPLGVAHVLLCEGPARAVDLGDGGCIFGVTAEALPLPSVLAPGFVPPPRRGGDAPCAALGDGATGRKAFGALFARLHGARSAAAVGHEEEDRTLVRAVGLWSAAHAFSSGFAASLAVRDDAIHVVRTDGESLVAIGPWDHLPGLALSLRDAFLRFTGGNARAGLGVSIATAEPREPVGELLRRARLDLAKLDVSLGGDGLCAFGSALPWSDAASVAEIAESLRALPERARREVLAGVGHLARASRLSGPARPGRNQGSVLRRVSGGWRTLGRLDALTGCAGSARAAIVPLTAAMRSGEWQGRRSESSIEFILGVAAQWCRLLHENGGQP